MEPWASVSILGLSSEVRDIQAETSVWDRRGGPGHGCSGFQLLWLQGTEKAAQKAGPRVQCEQGQGQDQREAGSSLLSSRSILKAVTCPGPYL